jgi:hypothetical protein
LNFSEGEKEKFSEIVVRKAIKSQEIQINLFEIKEEKELWNESVKRNSVEVLKK